MPRGGNPRPTTPEASELIRRLEELQRELGRAEARAEITERAESTLREDLERERERAEAERQRADELREALEAERSKGTLKRWSAASF